MYKSLDVVSSRSARLLGANRSIAEVSQLDATCLTMPSIGQAQVQWSALPVRLNVVITNIRLCNLSLCQYSQQHGKFVLFLQPVEFTAGLDVGSGGVKQPAGEGAGGLFSGASGPKPPAALSQAVLGMRPGGKVSETPMPLMSSPSDQALVCGEHLFSFVLPIMFKSALTSSLSSLASHVHLGNPCCSLHMNSCCQVCLLQASD